MYRERTDTLVRDGLTIVSFDKLLTWGNMDQRSCMLITDVCITGRVIIC